MTGKLEEQAYLETILKWAARKDNMTIDKYMAVHQFEPNANKLWSYYMQIITWVRSTFIKYRKEMKGLDWGALYDEFGDGIYDTAALENQIHDLMEDDEKLTYIIPAATKEHAGVMTAADKQQQDKLSEAVSELQRLVDESTGAIIPDLDIGFSVELI